MGNVVQTIGHAQMPWNWRSSSMLIAFRRRRHINVFTSSTNEYVLPVLQFTSHMRLDDMPIPPAQDGFMNCQRIQSVMMRQRWMDEIWAHPKAIVVCLWSVLALKWIDGQLGRSRIACAHIHSTHSFNIFIVHASKVFIWITVSCSSTFATRG